MKTSPLILHIFSLFAFSIISVCGCSSGYYDRYRTESSMRLTPFVQPDTMTDQDLRHLPLPVQKYLRYVGAVGKPRIVNFHAVFDGSMKRSKDSDWLDIKAEQYEFFGDNARLFYITSSMYGIPFDGFHRYIGDSATMQICIGGVFQIADARGEIMNRSETVTLFNDMCLMAPATLIDTTIRWQLVDSNRVNATFTNKRNSITAQLTFNETGELIMFSSDDRYLSEDGKEYKRYRWSTPVSNYKLISGRRIPMYGEAIWHMPEGEFPYARFTTTDISYNCTIFQ